MAELKTQKTELSVDAFINALADEQKRKDAFTILELMEAATKAKAKMWGSAIIGFGDKRLVYESGRELDWFIIELDFLPCNQRLFFFLQLFSSQLF